ncbi:bacterio-opsin activator HTH domain-containing protein [Halogeometricum pallidum JCM 14848]|uniref:Bacterio-opsin activator HTH domain-containing protein n=1 Tax=Halogeometricum pallidum JCM 14848 TaxID=1227487 RepID=M0D6N3_HALPD|nr:helix-turn-helix domain-containing protein [Halogeometricum pallidum]ELZ29819.1 bacterio-opsin activator HTH domain-containing protein [Halogeometricum pallidum JCM 14848]
MSLVAEFSLPRGDLLLGRVPTDWTGRVAFERFVSAPATPLSFLRASGDVEAFVASARADAAVESLVELDAAPAWTRYQLSWSPRVESVLEPLLRTATVVEAAASERWIFRLRFAEFDDVATFRQRIDDICVSLELRRLHEGSRAEETDRRMTDLQRRTLTVALREGYFEVPRSATLSDLAAELGVSKQAVSERLRRALSILAADAVGTTGTT